MTSIRLPEPGGDSDNWGGILNDFLRVAHNDNGSLKKDALITGAEQTANKGVADGYASLGSDGLVPDGQLPASFSLLPLAGDYIGVQMYSQTVNNTNGLLATWDAITASRGTSANWSADNSYQIVINQAGVYAINLMVDWSDSGDTSDSSRWAYINCSCQFITQDSRPSVRDGSTSTIQSLQLTVLLQSGDFIWVDMGQSSPGDLTPNAMMLVTLAMPVPNGTGPI